MVKYLLFDLETTGLPLNFKAHYSYLENWPRIVQFSWCVCDHLGNHEEVKDYIIKPVNFTIPSVSSNIHGISQEKALTSGENLVEILEKFKDDMRVCDYLVAHNLDFDKNVLLSEFARLGDGNGISIVDKIQKICTKTESTIFCKLRPFRYGHWKWPKLSELYYILFSSPVDHNKTHNSKYDVEVLKACFFGLLNRGLITL